jgi:quinol---cytochrome-c reductase cytochrome c subunit
VRLLNRSAGRISRHRRGPVAGLLVMLFGLLLTGGTYYAVFASPAQAQRTELSAEEKVAAGRELFLVGCSFCHGQNGEGVRREGGKSQIGPSLVGVGAAAVDFQVSTGRMPLQQPSAQGLVKKHVYDEEETELLSAFVASLGPGPSIPEPAEYDISLAGLSEDETRDAIVRGGQLFLTNCSACHNFEAAGGAMPQGKFAPGLKDTTDKHIYEAMLTGPSQMDKFTNGNIPPEGKRDIIAYLNSIEENPNYGGYGMGGLGPVSEGMFAWLGGIGVLVGFAYWIAAHTARSTKEEEAA